MARAAFWDVFEELWEHAPLAERLYALGPSGWPRMLTFERRLRGFVVEVDDSRQHELSSQWLTYADALLLGAGSISLPRACLAVALGREGYGKVLRGAVHVPVHALAPSVLSWLFIAEEAPPPSQVLERSGRIPTVPFALGLHLAPHDRAG